MRATGLYLDQSAFDPTDEDERNYFILDVVIGENISITVEGDFEEDPNHWGISYLFITVPEFGVDEEFQLESSLTDHFDPEFVERLINLPVTDWRI